MNFKPSKYPLPKAIYVDVDGTLVIRGKANHRLIEWLLKQQREGYELILWSSRGRDYALDAARCCGVQDLFDVILSKPGVIVDDKSWEWTRFVRSFKPPQ